MKPQHKSDLTLYILGSIVIAIVLALVLPELAMKFEVGGEIFLRLLKMMVVPLVMASVMSGIIGLGDVRELGRPGGYVVLYYVATTVLAVIVGLLVVNIMEPGIGAYDQQALNSLPRIDEMETGKEANINTILHNLVLMLFTDNLFQAAVEANLLPLIVFSVIFAGMLTTMGKRVKAITDMIVQINDALLSFVLLLMKVAPLGIFCLVAARFGEAQANGEFLKILSQTGQYVLTVLTALGIHGLITLPLILSIFTGRRPLHFI